VSQNWTRPPSATVRMTEGRLNALLKLRNHLSSRITRRCWLPVMSSRSFIQSAKTEGVGVLECVVAVAENDLASVVESGCRYHVDVAVIGVGDSHAAVLTEQFVPVVLLRLNAARTCCR
jgi:hypothetical protein